MDRNPNELSVCLSVCVCLPVCLSVCLCFCLSVCLSFCLSFSAHVFFGYSVERFKQGYKPYVQFKVRFLLYCIDFCAILHSERFGQFMRLGSHSDHSEPVWSTGPIVCPHRSHRRTDRILRQISYLGTCVAFPRQGSHSSPLFAAFSPGVAFKHLRSVFSTGFAFLRQVLHSQHMFFLLFCRAF